jgi:probable F420-dependent oxidoreductase
VWQERGEGIEVVRLGVFGLNSKIGIAPDLVRRLAVRCEVLGYDSWWVGEHVVLPSPRVPPSPMPPEDPILDPLVHLAFVAAVTDRLRLGTGIVILPQRNPLVLAKQVASLDALSGGRFVLGVGVGYLEPEMSAIGVPLAERASRTDDHLAAMRAIWYDPAPVAFSGPHTRFAGVDAHPRPLGTVPIVVGGHTAGAYRRAVEQGHGWYGFFRSPEQVVESVAGLTEAAERYDRPAGLGPLEISVTPAPRGRGGGNDLTPALVAEYAAAGVDRLIVYPLPLDDVEPTERFLEHHADVVLG